MLFQPQGGGDGSMLRSSLFSVSEIQAAFELPDPTALFAAANQLRMKLCRPGFVTYSIDPIINYTNVCNAYCSFCAFYRAPGHVQGYVLPLEAIDRKIDASI